VRFQALATDYDGTIARDGRVGMAALEALARLRKSGRRTILVTGRILSDLRRVFSELEQFDAIVAENGAVLYEPGTHKVTRLAEPPPLSFSEALRAKNVAPLELGEVIVATWEPHETTVLETIRELELDLTVVFNKGAVMVLPSNMNKASGLAALLRRMNLSAHNVAGIGDAENDLPFLAACEASAATANAVQSLKERADLTTRLDHAAGFAEFADRIVANELADVPAIDERHSIALGNTESGEHVVIPAASSGILLAGTSGGGKSQLVSGFAERVLEQGYQLCIVDPEGDYAMLSNVILSGDAQHTPSGNEVAGLVRGGQSFVVSLLAVPQADRPTFARRLFARIGEVHAHTGRPHWIVIDEAHHVLPAESGGSPGAVPAQSAFFVTTRPSLVASAALQRVDTVIAVGDGPSATIAEACRIIGVAAPAKPSAIEHAHAGTAVVWRRSAPREERAVQTIPGTSEHLRHVRKYAEGELAPAKSFYFTGPDDKLHLRAQNLMTFIQLAEGVDTETWAHHRRQHDYSRWIHDAIGDQALSEAVRAAEDGAELDDVSARDRIAAAIRNQYTAPA
jgi:hydroxymethylpyrimidine pyrophosphatase-like HAD family hydrolase